MEGELEAHKEGKDSVRVILQIVTAEVGPGRLQRIILAAPTSFSSGVVVGLTHMQASTPDLLHDIFAHRQRADTQAEAWRWPRSINGRSGGACP